ncbi:MAG: NUDIX domain-containing protein [Nocardioidaceae bacterium]|nr:NUDIX domain-containing protein [Nocardioidaceae bacterium]
MSEPDRPLLRIRPAARAVVTDPDCRVLLVHFDFPADNLPNGLWACPGGGLDPGEEMAAGLIRELREELGLEVADPGRPVWVKEHVFPMSRWDGQHDTYFWIRAEAFDPAPAFTKAELRAENLDGMRWWTYDEIREAQRVFDSGATDDPRFVTFTPRRLGHLLDDLLRHGRPAEPLRLPAM